MCMGWIINSAGTVEIIPTGLNLMPVADSSEMRLYRILANGLNKISAYLGIA